jgi:hypothetical protein
MVGILLSLWVFILIASVTSMCKLAHIRRRVCHSTFSLLSPAHSSTKSICILHAMLQTLHFLKVVHYKSTLCAYCSSTKLRFPYAYQRIEFYKISTRPKQVQRPSERSECQDHNLVSPRHSREHGIEVSAMDKRKRLFATVA